MVNNRHPEYEYRFPDWELVRTAVDGERAVKAKGEKFLPKPVGFDQDQYNEYLDRTEFFSATNRTLEGMSGMIFRKPPRISGISEAGIDDLVENVTRSGRGLIDFAQEVVNEVLVTGRAGVLVDYPMSDSEQSITIAEAQALGLRPFVRMYTAETIINWRTAIVAGKEELVLVVLEEEHEAEDEDEFSHDKEVKYRVLSLEDYDSPSRFYRIRIMTVRTDGSGERVEETEFDDVGMMNGEVIRSIPFSFVGPMSQGAEPQRSPLIDVASTNMSHYRTVADIEWGGHRSALPTFVITGHQRDPAEGPLYLGSDRALIFSEPDARAFFLEFTGAGMGVLTSLEQRKRERMAVLGARILQTDRGQVEAFETTSLNRVGEHSALASLASSVSHALTEKMKLAALWSGVEESIADDIEVELNTDYLPAEISAVDLQALVAAWQAEALTWDELTQALQRGELADPGLTAEERKEAIDQGAPLRFPPPIEDEDEGE